MKSALRLALLSGTRRSIGGSVTSNVPSGSRWGPCAAGPSCHAPRDSSIAVTASRCRPSSRLQALRSLSDPGSCSVDGCP